MVIVTPGVKLRGSEAPVPERRRLSAGPLTSTLEGGDLRSVRVGETEVLCRLYVGIRGPNWETIAPLYSNLCVEERHDAFSVEFDVENVGFGVDFAWHGSIRGVAGGAITYTIDGIARSAFRSNRIGFCILHPIACAGATCLVRHADGSFEEATFPEAIAPHQPMLDIVGICHQPRPGIRVDVDMAGEVFEMEDQRNWTDASFKTYCTPLRLPYPVEVEAGTCITQSVTVRVRAEVPNRPAMPRMRDRPVTLTAGQARPLPAIGIGIATHNFPLEPGEIERLRALRPRHLRVDLHLADPAARLRRAVRESLDLGIPLEVGLHISDAEPELAGLVEHLRRECPNVVRWLVFSEGGATTPSEILELARARLRTYGGGLPLVGGTDANFAELNRNRPDLRALDAVCYSINPQVHAFDDASLVETLAVQAATLESARTFCGDLPLVVSPVTLRPRFNPDATGPEAEPEPGELPRQVDPRQLSLFGAAWTLGSVTNLVRGGAASLTFFETTGWRGVVEREAGSVLPERFPSVPGMVFPLYHALADVCELVGATASVLESNDQPRAEGLVLDDGRRRRALVANLTPDPLHVRVEGFAAEAATLRVLDERTYDHATLDSVAFRAGPGERVHTADRGLDLDLAPHAVACIDVAPA